MKILIYNSGGGIGDSIQLFDILNSIKKNSSFNHEIIIHINEGSDGTFNFLQKNQYKTTYSKKKQFPFVGFARY